MIKLFVRHSEIVSGGLGAAAVLGGVFLVGAPVWLSVLVGLSLFAGLVLIGTDWTGRRIRREAHGLTMADMLRKIAEGRRQLHVIRGLCDTVEDEDIRRRVLRICDMAERIFDNFEKDPADVARSGRFLLYLDRFLPIIERYSRVASTREGLAMLRESGDDEEFRELLQTAEESFQQGYRNFLENDVVEMRTLSRVLKKMMSVAEIGK